MDLSDEVVSSDTTITGKHPPLIPNNGWDFYADEALCTLKSSFEEPLLISALIAAETAILDKHHLTTHDQPPPISLTRPPRTFTRSTQHSLLSRRYRL